MEIALRQNTAIMLDRLRRELNVSIEEATEIAINSALVILQRVRRDMKTYVVDRIETSEIVHTRYGAEAPKMVPLVERTEFSPKPMSTASTKKPKIKIKVKARRRFGRGNGGGRKVRAALKKREIARAAARKLLYKRLGVKPPKRKKAK